MLPATGRSQLPRQLEGQADVGKLEGQNDVVPGLNAPARNLLRCASDRGFVATGWGCSQYLDGIPLNPALE